MLKGSKHSIEAIEKMSLKLKGHIPWNKGKTLVPIEIKKQHKIDNDKKYKKSENYKKWRNEYRKRPEILAKERAQTINYRGQPDNYSKRMEYLNRSEVKERVNILKRKRREDNIYIKLSAYISSAIRHSIKKNKKGLHWEELVGYTIDDLKGHLEKQFANNMNWDNYSHSGWHIDHIIPISKFNFTTYDDIDFKRCWALSNLQPMWASENMSKGNRLDKSFQPCLGLAVAI